MRRPVGGAQTFLAYVGVALRGGHVAVSEQFLHDAQIGAVVEEVRGERVPQGMGMRRCERTVVEDPPHVARTESSPALVEEQRRDVGLGVAIVEDQAPQQPQFAPG